MSKPEAPQLRVVRTENEHPAGDRAGYIRLPHKVREAASPKALSVWCALAKYADWTTGECRVTTETIANASKWSRTKVKEAIKELQALGELHIVSGFNPDTKQWHSNTYKIIWPDAGVGRDASEGSVMRRPTPSHRATDLSREATTEQELSKQESINKNQKARPQAYPDLFEQLWNSYPRRVDKAKAHRAWQARCKDGTDPEVLIEAAAKYALQVTADRTEARYVKYLSTFLGPDRIFEEWLSAEPVTVAFTEEELVQIGAGVPRNEVLRRRGA